MHGTLQKPLICMYIDGYSNNGVVGFSFILDSAVVWYVVCLVFAHHSSLPPDKFITHSLYTGIVTIL